MRLGFALVGALLLASAAHSQTPASVAAAVSNPARPASDTARDAARKPDAMLDFSRVKPNDQVVDFIPGHGYFTRLFAVAVKPGGHVVAIVPPQSAKGDAEGAAMINAIAADAAYGDVSVIDSIGNPAIGKVNVFWTAQNYHDLHNALSVGEVIALNESIYKIVKPGGYYVIVDHAAAAGSGLAAAKDLHRIDPETVKAEVEAAGFIFDGDSGALANPDDPHTANIFDASIRGKTDQFMLRFKKPN